jgi:hypothetical protein
MKKIGYVFIYTFGAARVRAVAFCVVRGSPAYQAGATKYASSLMYEMTSLRALVTVRENDVRGTAQRKKTTTSVNISREHGITA